MAHLRQSSPTRTGLEHSDMETAAHGPAAAPAGRLGWAWFAGADRRVLAHVPSERSFFDAQGLVIFAMACVTGFAVAVAGSGWWSVPITHVLWLGVVWAAVICIVDRLIYKSFGTNRLTNLGLAVPRAALSLMLALVLGLPMVQFIFKPSIANQLTQTSALEQKHDKFTRLSGCENDDPSCSHTHRTGCGHWCRYYARQAAAARAALDRDRPVDRKKIAGLRAKIAAWQASEAHETTARVSAIAHDQDLLARAQALSAIEKQHPEVSRYVLFVLGLFVCLDLIALVMKLSHLLIGGGVYEEVAAALRERDRVEAHRIREETAVLRSRISQTARADASVDRVRIDRDRAKRIADDDLALVT
jgi:hypothetical protein